MSVAFPQPVRNLLLGLWIASSLAPLRGATLERLSLDDMIEKSTAIVRGRISGSYAAFRGDVIYTHYKVQVAERWKGPEQAVAEVMIPGGVANGIRQTYTGVPKLTEGKEYVLFLWTGRNGVTHVIGFTQGVFELPKRNTGEQLAYRAASSETMFERGTGRAVRDEPVEMALSALSQRIVQTLSNGARK
jgi:hypothetical protein